ncbi:hypothetical protein [Maridesulfovibrio sp.]|uniref:hypothetical protein n=1 Tax=Maridesulfovibrio sp. TaxID=2795000 RepID=UPI0029C9D9F5|nr:hypothetical protein [Maridesulfovibrio sp.]
MKIFFIAMLLTFITCSAGLAQDMNNLRDLKRPRYGIFEAEETKAPAPQKTNTQETARMNNSRFAGTFKGRVTVHYKNNMVTAEATLHIATGEKTDGSHYDNYIIPANKDYVQYKWKLDKNEVNRSVTVSGNTLYITDIIDYGKGGNSQIRTLVFSQDCSALTFLKTEFDDARKAPATGQIIGRFLRVKE